MYKNPQMPMTSEKPDPENPEVFEGVGLGQLFDVSFTNGPNCSFTGHHRLNRSSCSPALVLCPMRSVRTAALLAVLDEYEGWTPYDVKWVDEVCVQLMGVNGGKEGRKGRGSDVLVGTVAGHVPSSPRSSARSA